MQQTTLNAPPAREAEKQILTFTLGSKTSDPSGGCATDYGVDLLEVQEIRGYTPATPIPNTPSYIKGGMNLRGSVIPVMDLRIRFGANHLDYTKFTVIIVVQVAGKPSDWSPTASRTCFLYAPPRSCRQPTSASRTRAIASTASSTSKATSC